MAVDRKVAELRRVEAAAAAKAIRAPARPIPRVPIASAARAKRGSKPFAETVFELHLRQLERLVAQKGQTGLRSMYETALADLRKRLATAPRDPSRASPAELRALIAQAEAILAGFGGKFGNFLADVGKTAAEMGAKHAVDEYKRIEEHFRGATPVLQLERGAVFQGLIDTADQSLLGRYKNVTQAWTSSAIAEMERTLSVGAMAGRSWYELANQVAGEQGLLEHERYKAERIVRTELHHAHGATKFAAMRRTRDELGEGRLWKKLIATFDDRTGDDSFLVHGQAVPMDRPFEWKHRVRGSWVVTPYQHPPNRPNDREVVIPWDPSWDEQAGFEAPLSRAELAGARPTRWRATIGVRLPPGHKPGQPYTYKVPRPSEPPPEPPPAPKAAPKPPPKAPPPPPPAPTPVAAPAHPHARALETMRKGTVVSKEKLGGGANTSEKVVLESPTGTRTTAVWKPAAGEDPDLRDCIPVGTYYQREAAAYEFDRLLGGTPIVPPTTIRVNGPGDHGSLQEFHPEAYASDHPAIKGPFTDAHISGSIDTAPETKRLILLDVLQGNTDRHGGNVLWRRSAPDARGNIGAVPVAIDNGLAFPEGLRDLLYRWPREIDLLYVLGTFGAEEKRLLEGLRLEDVASTLLETGLSTKAVEGTLHRIAAFREDPTWLRKEAERLHREAGGGYQPSEHAKVAIEAFFRDSLDPPAEFLSDEARNEIKAAMKAGGKKASRPKRGPTV